MVFQFDPATLMTMAIVLLAAAAVVSVGLGRSGTTDRSRPWWTAAFLLGAFGFGATLMAPHDARALGRELANIAFLLAYGACYTGARLIAGRRVFIPGVLFGALVWAVVAWVIEMAAAPRMPVASFLITLYAAATAYEFLAGATPGERSRRLAGWLTAGHAAFYLVRTLFGPTFGMTRGWSQSAISLWGAIFAVETIFFATVLGALLLSIRGEKAASQSRDLAFTDALTGIGNRRAFDADMTALLARTKPGAAPASLVLLDLDGFKLVNDRHGHLAGDRLLCAVASALRAQLGSGDRAWRLGGDEFAILLAGHDAAGARSRLAIFKKIVFEAGWRADGGAEVRVSASCGVAECRHGTTLEAVVAEADRDLYASKRARSRAEDLVAAG